MFNKSSGGHRVKISQAAAGRDIVGVHEEHHHHAGKPVVWPVLVGSVPELADCFQDREFSVELARALGAGDSDGQTKMVREGCRQQVLTGLGGVGKTQLVAQVVHSFQQQWRRGPARDLDLVLWITADSREAIVTGYADAAVKIGEVDHPEISDERACQRFQEWLATTERRWIIILDDLQKPSDLSGLWPPQSSVGRYVVTTRFSDASLRHNSRQVIDVGLFTDKESVNYLHDKLRPWAATGASELAEALGNLPLALAQAAAYMVNRNISCADYLKRLADKRRRLADVVPDADGLPDEHRDTVAATWSLSIDFADQLSPVSLARPLLELACLLDPNGIPVDLFTAPSVLELLAAEWPEVDAVGIDDAWDALHNLQRLSLVTFDPIDQYRVVRVHALVQRVTRDGLTGTRMARIAYTAADSLVEIWPDRARFSAQERILRGCTAALLKHGSVNLWAADGPHIVQFSFGKSLGETGNVFGAVAYFEQLRGQVLQSLGRDSIGALKASNNLAFWRGRSGDPAGAIAELEQVLVSSEMLLGSEHPLTLNTRHSLASWRGESGDAVGAFKALEVLIPSLERAFGVRHPYTLITRHTKAVWGARAGDILGAAVALDGLSGRIERVLGADHPETLNVRCNAAVWRGEAGDVEGAARALKELVLDVERELGADHPQTLSVKHNAAIWRGESGDVREAVAGLEEVLPQLERVLGPDHRNTLTTRESLAFWKRGP